MSKSDLGEPPVEVQPFILATHDHPCLEDELWPLKGRRGSWSLWMLLDGRAKWMRKGHDPVLIGKGQALLRWRGIGGHLQLPMGSVIRGVEFDMALRERVAHECYGWQPLSGSGPARHQSPGTFLGKTHHISSMALWPCALTVF